MTDVPLQSDHLAQTIGDVCLKWVHIEHLIHDVALHLAMCVDPAFEAERTLGVLHTSLAVMDVREKIILAKAYAFHTSSPAHPDFYDRAERLLNHVDNELRPERNRYVHDYWDLDEVEIRRLTFGPKVVRPQSRERALLMWVEKKFANAKAMRGLIENLDFAYLDLVELDNHTAWICHQRAQPSAPPQPLPLEWKSLTHRGWRDAGTPPPPPPPSPA